MSTSSPRTHGEIAPGVAPSDTMDVPGRRLSIGATGLSRRGGSYRLIAPIARGGMGELYLAEYVSDGGAREQVIIKRLLESLREDNAHVAMFRSEAEHLALLDHKNIVRVLDVPEIGGARCLALEYVRGRSVAQILDRARYVGRRIPPEIAVYVVTEVLEGLDHVHRARLADGQPVGLVHRDVTPGNLLVSFDGDVKITDFGISKSVMSKVSTTVGIVKGKARYLAPEQILGEAASPRSDMFSAACVIYEMLTSVPLFERVSVPKTLTAIVHGEMPELRTVLPIPSAHRTVALIARTLSVDAALRHERARELAEELRAAAAMELGPLVGRAAVSAYMRQLFEGQDESWEQASGAPEEVDPSNPVIAFEELVEPPGARPSTSGERPPPALRAASIADAEAIEPLDTDPPPPFVPPPPDSADDSLDQPRARGPEPTMVVERARGRNAPTEVVVRVAAPVRDGPGRNESITPVLDGEEATLAVSARSPLDDRGDSGIQPAARDPERTPRVIEHDAATQSEIVLGGGRAAASIKVTTPDDLDDSTEAYDQDEEPPVSPREPTRVERPLLVRRPEATVISERLVGTVPAREPRDVREGRGARDVREGRSAREPRDVREGRSAREPRDARNPRSRPTASSPRPALAWLVERPLLALALVFVLGTATGVAITAALRPAAPLPIAPSATVVPSEAAPELEPDPAELAAPVPSAEGALEPPREEEPEPEPEVDAEAVPRVEPSVPADRATLDVLYPRDARVRLDGRWLTGRVPLHDVEVEPGKHQLTIEWKRRRRDLVIEVPAGGRAAVTAKDWRR